MFYNSFIILCLFKYIYLNSYFIHAYCELFLNYVIILVRMDDRDEYVVQLCGLLESKINQLETSQFISEETFKNLISTVNKNYQGRYKTSPDSGQIEMLTSEVLDKLEYERILVPRFRVYVAEDEKKGWKKKSLTIFNSSFP